MNLVFDTSILIGIERRNEAMLDKIRQYAELYPEVPQITFITFFEFYDGLRNKNLKNKAKSLSFINRFSMLEVTKRTAEILSDLKAEVETQGKNLPLADLMIASQVIEHGLILLTLDKDFENIRRLNKIIL